MNGMIVYGIFSTFRTTVLFAMSSKKKGIFVSPDKSLDLKF